MDRALKQRLVGATILIALAVIFVPMLLDGEGSDPAATRTIDIPPRPDVEFQTRRLPIGEHSAQPEDTSGLQGTEPPVNVAPVPDSPETSTINESADDSSGTLTPVDEAESPKEGAPTVRPLATPADTQSLNSTATTPEPSVEQPNQTAPQHSDSEPVLESSATDDAVTPSPVPETQWRIQVGSFSSRENAENLTTRLRGQGFAAALTPVTVNGSTIYRVITGPYATQAEADARMLRLMAEAPGFSPKMTGPGATPARAITRSGFSVQVGSFSNEAFAQEFMDTLQRDGNPVYFKAPSDGASRFYRVYVGPYSEREAAAQKCRALTAERQLDCIVITEGG